MRGQLPARRVCESGTAPFQPIEKLAHAQALKRFVGGAGAIRVSRRTDLEAMVRGRTVLHRDIERRCESCGAAIASAGLLQRLEALLGDADPALTDRLGRFRAACRD